MSDQESTKEVGLTHVLARAITDEEVRKRLFLEPDALADEYELTPRDRDTMKRISPADIEEATRQLDKRSWWGIAIFIKIEF